MQPKARNLRHISAQTQNKLNFMKKILLVTCFIALSNLQNSFSQAWQWAYTESTTPRSQAVAVKEDQTGNVYTASFTDSVSTRVYSTMIKRDINQQIIWQKQIMGNATITDLEINSINHAIVVGYYLGTISIDGSSLTSFSLTENSGFIFETDENGMVLWVRDINPANGDFKTGDLFIGTDGNFKFMQTF